MASGSKELLLIMAEFEEKKKVEQNLHQHHGCYIALLVALHFPSSDWEIHLVIKMQNIFEM